MLSVMLFQIRTNIRSASRAGQDPCRNVEWSNSRRQRPRNRKAQASYDQNGNNPLEHPGRIRVSHRPVRLELRCRRAHRSLRDPQSRRVGKSICRRGLYGKCLGRGKLSTAERVTRPGGVKSNRSRPGKKALASATSTQDCPSREADHEGHDNRKGNRFSRSGPQGNCSAAPIVVRFLEIERHPQGRGANTAARAPAATIPTRTTPLTLKSGTVRN